MNQLIKLLLVSFILIGFARNVSAENSEALVVEETQKTSNTDANKNKAALDAAKLAEILAETLTFQATFEQRVYRENSDNPEVTKGRFLIQRPNHFRWQTVSPFEQSLIADGTHLWTYDPELEQVTIQNQQAVLADSPLLLLTSSVDALLDAFTILEIKNTDVNEGQLFSLSPKENSVFESIHILIKDKAIKEFFLVDTLGGRSSVNFNDVSRNQKLDLNEFIFVAPEGIDVIDSRETIAGDDAKE